MQKKEEKEFISNEYCFNVDCSFITICKSLSNIIDIENTFFKALYESQLEDNPFHIIGFNNKNQIKLTYQDTSVIFFNESLLLFKKKYVKTIDIKDDNNYTISYKITEYHSSKINPVNYELSFFINYIIGSTVILVRLIYIPISKSKNIFNSKMKKLLNEYMTNLRTNVLKSNNTIIMSAIINTNRQNLFSMLIALISPNHNNENYQVVHEDNDSDYKVGHKFWINWKAQDWNIKMGYMITNYYITDDDSKDCYYGAEMIDSNPIQPSYNFLHTIKKISENKSLLIIKEVFSENIPEFLRSQHSNTVKSLFHDLLNQTN
jgi:hypothetical protein